MPKNVELLTEHPWAIQIVKAKMTNPAPFAVTLKEFGQDMWVNGNYSAEDPSLPPFVNMKIATFKFPQIHLSHGDNDVDITVNMTLETKPVDGQGVAGNETVDPIAVWNAFQTAIGFGQIPSFVEKYKIRPYMKLSAGTMWLKSMGLPLPFSYHSNFNMICFLMMDKNGNPQPNPEHPLNTSTVPGCADIGGCKAPQQINCNQTEDFVNPWDSDSVQQLNEQLQHFLM